jgi:hypothetical protein
VSGAEAAKEARFGHDWSSTRRLIGGGIGKSRIARTVAERTDAGLRYFCSPSQSPLAPRRGAIPSDSQSNSRLVRPTWQLRPRPHRLTVRTAGLGSSFLGS